MQRAEATSSEADRASRDQQGDLVLAVLRQRCPDLRLTVAQYVAIVYPRCELSPEQLCELDGKVAAELARQTRVCNQAAQ